MNTTKKKQINRYREQSSDYHWGEGREEGQYRGRGLRSTNYDVYYKLQGHIVQCGMGNIVNILEYL